MYRGRRRFGVREGPRAHLRRPDKIAPGGSPEPNADAGPRPGQRAGAPRAPARPSCPRGVGDAVRTAPRPTGTARRCRSRRSAPGCRPGARAASAPRRPARRRTRRRRSMPSSRAARCAKSKASSSVDLDRRRRACRSCRFVGMKPAPMPWMRCGLGVAAADDRRLRRLHGEDLQLREVRPSAPRRTPVMWPPVPTPVMR